MELGGSSIFQGRRLTEEPSTAKPKVFELVAWLGRFFGRPLGMKRLSNVFGDKLFSKWV